MIHRLLQFFSAVWALSFIYISPDPSSHLTKDLKAALLVMSIMVASATPASPAAPVPGASDQESIQTAIAEMTKSLSWTELINCRRLMFLLRYTDSGAILRLDTKNTCSNCEVVAAWCRNYVLKAQYWASCRGKVVSRVHLHLSWGQSVKLFKPEWPLQLLGGSDGPERVWSNWQ